MLGCGRQGHGRFWSRFPRSAGDDSKNAGGVDGPQEGPRIQIAFAGRPPAARRAEERREELMKSKLLARKSLEDLTREATATTHGLKRVLGPWDLIFLGIGAIVGAGIFVITGHAAAQDAGPARHHRPDWLVRLHGQFS